MNREFLAELRVGRVFVCLKYDLRLAILTAVARSVEVAFLTWNERTLAVTFDQRHDNMLLGPVSGSTSIKGVTSLRITLFFEIPLRTLRTASKGRERPYRAPIPPSMGDPNASILAPQPVHYRPMSARSGVA